MGYIYLKSSDVKLYGGILDVSLFLHINNMAIGS